MLRRLFLSAALATACSSGGATTTDAGTAADVGGASPSACEALCVASSCGNGCAAACTAGGAAVPQCQGQYNAVIQCAARNGQRCMPMQGGGPACAAEAQTLSACVSGDADAGTGGTDAGASETDAGTDEVDAGTVTGPSIGGRWTFSTTAPMFAHELNFMGGPTTGTVGYQSVNTLETSGCVTTNEYAGRWTRTGETLSVTLNSGSTEVTMCNDSSRNMVAMALPEDNVASVATSYTGPITVSESTLTFTMFRGTSSRAFTRAP